MKGLMCSFYLNIWLETSYVFSIKITYFIKSKSLLEELQIMYTWE
jgi:hypothetical protein